jgi:hypothetical protein
MEASVAMPPYYSPKERTQPLTIRIPESLKRELEEISEIWTAVEERAGSGEKVSVNNVIVRLLRVGVDGVWGEFGTKPHPHDEKEKKALVERMVRAVAESKQ